MLPVLHYQDGCKEAHNPTSPQGRNRRKGREAQYHHQQDKPTRNATREQGKKGRERERKEKEPRQASKPTKKRGTPPYRQGAGSPSPHHKFAPKNQQKVAWGRFEKIFGKIFRWNVSGERKTPRVISTEGERR